MASPKVTPQLTADVVEAKVLVAVGTFAPDGAHGTIQLHVGDGSGVSVYVGTADPTGTVTLPAGSLYLRHVDADHGELWVKVGPTAADWQKVAG